jgi:hypothetical protein
MQISDEDATELFNICKNITIPLQQYKKYENGTEARGGRAKQFGNHRAALLGYTLARFKPRSIGPQLSYFSKKHVIKSPKKMIRNLIDYFKDFSLRKLLNIFLFPFLFPYIILRNL